MKYTEDHEWVRLEGDQAQIGISAYAVEQLGDLVFVELPEIGMQIQKGDSFAVVESVKAASDVYAPVSGEVVGVNPELESAPETLNADPEDKAFIAIIKLANPDELDDMMDKPAYDAFCKGL